MIISLFAAFVYLFGQSKIFPYCSQPAAFCPRREWSNVDRFLEVRARDLARFWYEEARKEKEVEDRAVRGITAGCVRWETEDHNRGF